MKRLLDAVCELIEAQAARVRTETLDQELEYADWKQSQGNDGDI